jgi:phosphoribosyl-ATP pyrophosphohydrolase
MEKEIGQLKERVADRERERDHASDVADAVMRENKSLVERVKRLEEAGDTLAAVTIRNGRSHSKWHAAKETKP